MQRLYRPLLQKDFQQDKSHPEPSSYRRPGRASLQVAFEKGHTYLVNDIRLISREVCISKIVVELLHATSVQTSLTKDFQQDKPHPEPSS